MLKNKNNEREFLSNAEFFINFERSYNLFQLVKILDFMGLKYEDLYLNNVQSETLRKTLYKEKTNVLSYYVIKTILLNNYSDFLLWCEKNNLSLIAFKKTITNQKKFCQFIERNYNTNMMIENIYQSELFFQYLKKVKNNKIKSKNHLVDKLLNNLRMTICELG
jgi:hypothetical protein